MGILQSGCIVVPAALVALACGDSGGGGGFGGVGGTAASGGSSAASAGGSSGSSVGGAGGGAGSINLGGSGGTAATGSGGVAGVDCDQQLQGTLRDFFASHPDFEYVIGTDKAIVTNQIGADGKPVYAGNPTTPTTNGQASFDQWFRDVPMVNMPVAHGITLVDAGNGNYVYDDGAFFPLDNQAFGNEGRAHNYHFTLEIHTQFEYRGGEVFTFRGDDDLFTYVNGVLAINLGGVHGAQEETIDLDARSAELGIVVGQTYPLDFFFAERHTSESNFRIETTIGCFTPVIPK